MSRRRQLAGRESPLVTIKGFLGFLERDALAGDFERMKVDLRLWQKRIRSPRGR